MQSTDSRSVSSTRPLESGGPSNEGTWISPETAAGFEVPEAAPEGRGVEPSFRPSRRRASIAALLLAFEAAALGANVLLLAATLWMTARLDAGIGDAGVWRLLNGGLVVVSAAYVIGFVASAVALLAWLHRAVANLGAFDLEVGTYSPRRAVLCWFIPVLNLLEPYYVMDALRDALAGPTEARAGRRLLRGWWVTWIGGSCAGGMATFVLPNNAVSTAWYAGHALLQLPLFAAAVLAVAVVRHVQGLADARVGELEGDGAAAERSLSRASRPRVFAVPVALAGLGVTIGAVVLVVALAWVPPGPTWTQFMADGGVFSIVFPRQPVEQSDTTQSAVGPVTEHRFDARLDRAMSYTVSYTDYPAGSLVRVDPQLVLDRLVGSTGAASAGATAIRLELHGIPGRAVDVPMSGGMMACVRFYVQEDRVYLLEVDTTVARADSVDVARFFGSFAPR